MTYGVADPEDTKLVWQVLCLVTELTKDMAESEETVPPPRSITSGNSQDVGF